MTVVPNTIDLRPETAHVKVSRGDAWSIKVTLTGFNLTGYEILGQVRPTAEDDTSVNLTITASGADLTAGIFYYGQTEATISGVYDVQLAPSGGAPRTYIKGRLTVEPDVTRD